ncbi:head decoration protein [Roseomonas frigidaquae]|uniref:Head decoration protein n=1 Tax=Falsiroseomonas frigidaquae TaxID=487318 RepID=A0ABX1EU46_9PROT|nr:head decoration protein [Falsiroseomonas frigidaquae]NKE43572.1 head decoration protein [Falsiroseomonas frigidaquae]
MPGPRVFTETFTPDRLIAGLTQPVHENGLLISGQNLARGAVVGKITASGKLTLSLSASSDGSQVPYGVLADACDATGGDLANCPILIAGEVNESALILGTGHTLASIRAGLRDKGIHLKSVIPA